MKVLQRLGKNILLTSILIIPVLILFARPLIEGRALTPGDVLFRYPAWKSEFANVIPQNSLLSDQIFQFYPWHLLAYKTAAQTGRFPLWNPYELSGQPLVGNAQSALFYPPNLLLFILSPAVVSVLRAMFNLLIAGVFTFLLCKKLGLTNIGSTFSAVAFMLSGPLIVWLGHPHANVLAVFPLQIWAAEKIIQKPKLGLAWFALSLGIGLSILGGHPETTFHASFLLGVYYLGRVIMQPGDWRKKIESLVLGLSAALSGALIGAVQWLPFVEFLMKSSTLAGGGRSMGHGSLFYNSEWWSNLATVFSLLIPNIFGSPVYRNYYWPSSSYQNYNEQSIYFGLIPFVFSLMSLRLNKSRSRLFLMLIGLFCLAVAWRLPLLEVINQVPPFSIMLNKRLKMFFTFFFAVLAGFGLDAWTTDKQTNSNKLPGSVLAASIFILTLAIICLFFVVGVGPVQSALQSSSLPYKEYFLYASQYIFNRNQPAAYVTGISSVIVLFLLILFWGKRINLTKFKAGLLLLTVCELMVLAWNYNPTIDQRLVFPDIPLVDQLSMESEPFRIMGSDVFPENTGSAYGIAQIEGYDLPVYALASSVYYAQGGKGPDYHQQWQPDWPLVDWLNIKYVLSRSPLSNPKYQLIRENQDFLLYENTEVLPRSFIVYDYQVIKSDADALSRITNKGFDFRSKVILKSEPEPFFSVPSEKKEGHQQKVTFENYGTDQVLMQVFTDAPGILVMSDIYYPGWKVFVDHQEQPLLQANYAYRAVILPAGSHSVQFSYQPKSFYIGIIFSLLGGVTLLGVGINFLVSRIQQKTRNGMSTGKGLRITKTYLGCFLQFF